MTDLRETFADVAALIPKFSWAIMDEEQRDDLMEKVVLPRYMSTTSDGVQLGPTAWAEIVGATYNAIESRVKRLRQSQVRGDDDTARRDEQRKHRATRQVLRESTPEQVAELLDAPEIRVNVSKAQQIVHEKMGAESRKAQREAIGERESDALEHEQRFRDAEAELFKARRGLIEFLRLLQEAGVGNLLDSWAEQLLGTLADIEAKAGMGRALLGGEITDADLLELLEG